MLEDFSLNLEFSIAKYGCVLVHATWLGKGIFHRSMSRLNNIIALPKKRRISHSQRQTSATNFFHSRHRCSLSRVKNVLQKKRIIRIKVKKKIIMQTYSA